MLLMLLNLAMALGKERAFWHALEMLIEKDAVSARYGELHSNVEQRLDFAKKEMARLEVEVVCLTQDRDASVAKGTIVYV